MTDVVFHDDVIEKGDYGVPEAPLSTPDENFNRPNSAQPSPPSYATATNPDPLHPFFQLVILFSRRTMDKFILCSSEEFNEIISFHSWSFIVT